MKLELYSYISISSTLFSISENNPFKKGSRNVMPFPTRWIQPKLLLKVPQLLLAHLQPQPQLLLESATATASSNPLFFWKCHSFFWPICSLSVLLSDWIHFLIAPSLLKVKEERSSIPFEKAVTTALSNSLSHWSKKKAKGISSTCTNPSLYYILFLPNR